MQNDAITKIRFLPRDLLRHSGVGALVAHNQMLDWGSEALSRVPAVGVRRRLRRWTGLSQRTRVNQIATWRRDCTDCVRLETRDACCMWTKRNATVPFTKRIWSDTGTKFVEPWTRRTPMSVAFLFPGHGSQRPRMLRILPDSSEVAVTVQEGRPVVADAVMATNTEGTLASTVATQIVLYTAGVAVARSLVASGGMPEVPMGAHAVAAACSVIAFAAGLRLVRRRAPLRGTLFLRGYGLSAIVGRNAKQVSQLVDQATAPVHQVFLGNANALARRVVAGAFEWLDTGVALGPGGWMQKGRTVSRMGSRALSVAEHAARRLLEAIKDVAYKQHCLGCILH